MSERKDHFNLFQRIFYRIIRPILNDKAYAQMSLKRWFGEGGNLDNPRTFNEKIQWLKLYDCKSEYTRLADKYAVRDFVNERLESEEYLNELYGVWESPSEIDFTALPESFVLKATHGSGTNILVVDKNKIDLTEVLEQLNEWLCLDYARRGREWVYRDIPRRIIAERLLIDVNSGDLPKDYKVFCFHGRPKYIQVDIDRFCDHKRAFFDTEWVRQPFSILYTQSEQPVKKPARLEEMLVAAGKLSAGIPFVRVDFYALPELIFGEMTFYPEGGTGPFLPVQWDFRVGQELELPNV